MASWKDLPPELLLKVAHGSDGGCGMNGVCSSWKQSLEATCTKIILSGSALPQNLATRCPSLTALDLRGCISVSALALQQLEPLHLASLALKLDQDDLTEDRDEDECVEMLLRDDYKLSNAIVSSLETLQIPETSLVLHVDIDFNEDTVTQDALRRLNLTTLELAGLDFSQPCRFYYLTCARSLVEYVVWGLPLVKLDISYIAVNSDLEYLSSCRFPLTQLSLANCDVTDAGIEFLRQLPLTDLNLSGCTKLTDATLFALAEMGFPLTALDISGWDRVGRRAYGLMFHEEGTRFSDSGLEALRGSPLKSLSVSLCENSDGNFEALRGMNLEVLDFTRMPEVVYDGSLEVLEGMPLKLLNLADCHRITDVGLLHLHGMSLTSLDLSCQAGTSVEGEVWGNVSDQGLEVLRGMKLKVLKLSRCRKITDEGLQVLREMPLVDLCLDDCNLVFDTGLEVLRGMPLTRLSLFGCPNISDRGIEQLSGLPLSDLSFGPSEIVNIYAFEGVCSASLTKLSIRGCTRVACLHIFDGLTSLTDLSITGCEYLSAEEMDRFWKARNKINAQKYEDMIKKFEARGKQLHSLGILPVYSDVSSLPLTGKRTVVSNIELVRKYKSKTYSPQGF